MQVVHVCWVCQGMKTSLAAETSQFILVATAVAAWIAMGEDFEVIRECEAA